MSRELSIAYTAGATVTAKIVNHASGSVLGTVTLTENPTSFFYGNMPTASAAVFDVVFFDGPYPIGGKQIIWNGTAVVGSEDATLASIKAKTDLINATGVKVIYTTPVATDGTVTITKGDDYNSHTTPLTFAITGDNVPNLTGATAKLFIYANPQRCQILAINGTIANPSSNPLLTFALTSIQTNLIIGEPGYEYTVGAVLTTGETITFQLGELIVEG